MGTTRGKQVAPSAHLCSVSGLERIDYVDVFAIDVGRLAPATAEEWARTVVEDVAREGGQFIWRGVLQLDLLRFPVQERIGGWKLEVIGPQMVRLQAASPRMTVHIVVDSTDGRLSVGTFVRYDRATGRVMWMPLAIIHRALMPGLLGNSVRFQQRRQATRT
jgi:hypothetical protein